MDQLLGFQFPLFHRNENTKLFNCNTFSFLVHPCLSAPVEVFSWVGMKIYIEIPMGIENLLFSAQKSQWEWFWSAIFFLQPSEISGIFYQRGRFFGQFFLWGGVPPGLWHGGGHSWWYIVQFSFRFSYDQSPWGILWN